jgi:hypothetical protein
MDFSGATLAAFSDEGAAEAYRFSQMEVVAADPKTLKIKSN